MFAKEDHNTALLAVQTCNGIKVGGRPLRVDLATTDPQLEGKTTVWGEFVTESHVRMQRYERQCEGGRKRKRERQENPDFDVHHGSNRSTSTQSEVAAFLECTVLKS